MSRIIFLLALLAPQLARADDPDDKLYACRTATGAITASFKPETKIKDLAVWLSGFTCKNVVLGAGVAQSDAAVTIIAPTKMTPKQAIQLWIDAVQAAGFVVVQKPDTFIVRLGPDMARACPRVAAVDESTGSKVPEPAAEVDIAAYVRRIDDTHVHVARAFADRINADPTTHLSRSARLVPALLEGKAAGFKLYAIRPNTTIDALGFKNGDTIVAVNGMPLVTAQNALDAYTKLRETKEPVFDIVRAGKPLQLHIAIVAKL